MTAHIEQHRATISALERRFDTRARLLPAQRPLVAALATGIAGLDALLAHGGLPYGSLVTLCGQVGGQRRLAELSILAAQQRGNLVCYVDPGGTFSAATAEAAGIDMSALLQAQPASSGEALDLLFALAASGDAGLVVVDSLSRLVAAAIDAGRQSALEQLASLLGRSQTLMLGLLEDEPPLARRSALALAAANDVRIMVEAAGAVEQHGLFGEHVTVTALRSRVTVMSRHGLPAQRSADVMLAFAPA